jgi:hypothetical protein
MPIACVWTCVEDAIHNVMSRRHEEQENEQDVDHDDDDVATNDRYV